MYPYALRTVYQATASLSYASCRCFGNSATGFRRTRAPSLKTHTFGRVVHVDMCEHVPRARVTNRRSLTGPPSRPCRLPWCSLYVLHAGKMQAVASFILATLVFSPSVHGETTPSVGVVRKSRWEGASYVHDFLENSRVVEGTVYAQRSRRLVTLGSLF